MSQIIKWAPLFDPFEEFEKFFGDNMPARSALRGFAPAMDIYQTKDAVVVETPLPGIDPVKADISIENDILTIQGASEKKSEVEEKDYFRREVRSGNFYRTIALPAHVDGDKASASYEDGMLKVSIPKKKAPKSKKLKVEVKKK